MYPRCCRAARSADTDVRSSSVWPMCWRGGTGAMVTTTGPKGWRWQRTSFDASSGRFGYDLLALSRPDVIRGQGRKSRAHLVAFATPEFAPSLELSLHAARGYFASLRAWTREQLRSTHFYRRNRRILEETRGAGYWLWKPFIIRERLSQVPRGDIVVYLDAGARFRADPSALFAVAREREIVVFANPYGAARGAAACSTWTKRDCFVLMGCDEPRYHHAPMVDASIVLFRNTRGGRAFVAEWLSFSQRANILTDAPNSCGLANLEDFVEHRHDQSVLSLLVERAGLELFRVPNQQGNHLKAAPWRVPGEWCRAPYAAADSFSNSPYGTLVDHHRLRSLMSTAPDGIGELLCQALDAPRRLLLLGTDAQEARRVSSSWPRTTVVAETAEPEVWGRLHGRRFDAVVCAMRCVGDRPPFGFPDLFTRDLLASDAVICWADLEGVDGIRSAIAALVPAVRARVRMVAGTIRARREREPRIVALLKVFAAARK